MSEPDDLLDRLFTQAREIVLGERNRFDLEFDQIALLVSDEVLQARFRARLRLEAQNKEARELILLYLRSLASKEDDAAEDISADADGIDVYVGRPGIGTTSAAIAMLFAPGVGILAAVLFLVAGLIAMASGGIASNVLRKRAGRHRSFAARARALVEDSNDA